MQPHKSTAPPDATMREHCAWEQAIFMLCGHHKVSHHALNLIASAAGAVIGWQVHSYARSLLSQETDHTELSAV